METAIRSVGMVPNLWCFLGSEEMLLMVQRSCDHHLRLVVEIPLKLRVLYIHPGVVTSWSSEPSTVSKPVLLISWEKLDFTSIWVNFV